jgi:hypothetical protein
MGHATSGQSSLNDQEFFRRMRKLIGRRCRHLGQRCMLIDVLADEGTLILRCEEGEPPVQSDQFGHALRRAYETREVAVFDADGDTLTPETLDLLAAFESEAA